MEKTPRLPFEYRMTKTQRILGWIYLPLHVVAFPILFGMLAGSLPETLSESRANLIYYAVGIVFCLTVMFRYLRAEFDGLLDRPMRSLGTILLAVCAVYAMSFVAGVILLALNATIENPGNAEILDLAKVDYGAVRAIAVYLAPIVEETLFRGVIFGSLRTRSRALAYAVSVAAFSLYHVWQFAVLGDWTALLYAIQYIPVSVALAWCYERSGSLWTNIFFHMGYNAFNFAVLRVVSG